MNCRVLVVEDDRYGWQVVQHMLTFHQIEADIAMSGEEALQLLANHDYALAILDLALPGIDGWSVLKAVQNDPRTTQLRCVAVTAFHDAKVAKEALEAGFIACFPKPLRTTFGKEIETLCNEQA
jgi:CheY-like chemotaxis protein